MGGPSDRRRPEELDEADRPPADGYCWASAACWDRLIGGDPRGTRGKSQQVLPPERQNKLFVIHDLIYYLISNLETIKKP